MRITLFTVDKANKLLKEMKPLIEQLVAGRREMRRIEARLDVMSLALAGASSSNPDATETRQLVTQRTEIASRVRKGLEQIQQRGCVVKDLDQGLLDFYSLAGDRLVFLCWKLGEPEIQHWHTLDGGFASRRPLDGSPLEDR